MYLQGNEYEGPMEEYDDEEEEEDEDAEGMQEVLLLLLLGVTDVYRNDTFSIYCLVVIY